jgi:hypothetical protein
VIHMFKVAGWMVSEHEPRNFSHVVCPRCSWLVLKNQRDFEEHCTACPNRTKANMTDLDTAALQGPDIKVEHPSYGVPIVIDVTMTSHTLDAGEGAAVAAEATFLKREKRKNKLYQKPAEADGCEFFVLTVTSTGKISGTTAATPSRCKISATSLPLAPSQHAVSLSSMLRSVSVSSIRPRPSPRASASATPPIIAVK